MGAVRRSLDSFPGNDPRVVWPPCSQRLAQDSNGCRCVALYPSRAQGFCNRRLSSKSGSIAKCCQSTTSEVSDAKALTNLDAWLGQERWDVIYFSFGLHALKTDRHGRHAVPIEKYVRHLEQIVERLKLTGASLVWATATPVQTGHDRRTLADVAC